MRRKNLIVETREHRLWKAFKIAKYRTRAKYQATTFFQKESETTFSKLQSIFFHKRFFVLIAQRNVKGKKKKFHRDPEVRATETPEKP